MTSRNSGKTVEMNGLGQGRASKCSNTNHANPKSDDEMVKVRRHGSLFSRRIKAMQKTKVVGSMPIIAVELRNAMIHDRKIEALWATIEVGIELSASISR